MFRSEMRLSGRDVFLLLLAANAVTSVSVRGQVYDQTSPDLGIRANLLLDYHSPVFSGCPHGTVVAASCLFDGLGDDVYREFVARALSQVSPLIACGTPLAEALSTAENQTFGELILRSEARILTLDERLMTVAENHGLPPEVGSRLNQLPALGSDSVLHTPRPAGGVIDSAVIRSAVEMDCHQSAFTEAALAALIGMRPPQNSVVDFQAPQMH